MKSCIVCVLSCTVACAHTIKEEFAPYLKDLEELGYCVVPEVIPRFETEVLYERVWKEFIEKAWPLCRMNDRSNWYETFPRHHKLGIFAGPAGQIQVMWDLRQDPRIVEIFAQVWNTKSLIVSMDGLSILCPPEIREDHFDPWPHVDQCSYLPNNFVSESSLVSHPFTVQGQFLFEDSFEGDGGFYCIPKSHLRFSEFAIELERLDRSRISPIEKEEAKYKFLQNFFNREFYSIKHIKAPRGSLILWDSRTVHWSEPAGKDRPKVGIPKIRMVGYLCYVPKSRLTSEILSGRKKAFQRGITTGHDPTRPVLKYTKTRISSEFKKYLEDPDYIQPDIELTPLGYSLLGYDG